MGELSGLFDPDAVAVVGATDREGSVGRALVENLRRFEGEVVAVNPNRESVLGLRSYPDLSSAPPVDLAVVAVPPGVAVDVVREAGENGVRAAVVITAGFSETGGEGAAMERDLREVAEEYGIHLVGPNSLGVSSTRRGLNATFGPGFPDPGGLSLMSQSGAFITAVLDWAAETGLGFRDIVSLGNKAALTEVDFVREWGDDPGTDAVVGYLESIPEGREFLETTREVTRETPVVLVKSGRTDAGAKAASSHTGAIAGSERAYEAALDQAGVIRARTVQELFDSARALSGLPLPETDGVAVVTNAGGPGVLATDAVGDADLRLAEFSESTVADLQSTLPDTANVHNPVDVIGDADVERFRAALEAVLSDDDVGAAVVVSAPTAVLDYAELAAAVADRVDESGLPVVACFMGGERVRPAAEALAERGIPNYFDPARAVGGLDALAEYRAIRERTHESPSEFDVDREWTREVLTTADGRTRLGVEAMDLLRAYGVDVPHGEVVDDPADAEAVARSMDGPVVMKVVSPDVLHKSDIGGVKVGVPAAEVYDAYEDLVARAYSYRPDATVLGVQVQELLDLEGTTETIVGINRDPQFGPLVLFGLGGVFVEVLEDTSVRVAPVSEPEIREMVGAIRAAPLLRGARGRPPADLDALVETVARLSQLAVDFPAILELDVNPLVAGPDGVQAVDVRLTLDPEEL